MASLVLGAVAMMIFYDLELSSSDPLGQIVNYAFVEVDDDLTPQEELIGTVRLNRTQLPDLENVLQGQLDLDLIQDLGELEFIAAHKISRFLQGKVEKNSDCWLVGYNSSRVQDRFLKNLLLRYGLNSDFKPLIYRDLRHFVEYKAHLSALELPKLVMPSQVLHTDSFSNLKAYCSALRLIQRPDRNGARSRVLLMLDLLKRVQGHSGPTFRSFDPVDKGPLQALFGVGKQRVLERGKIETRYWMALSACTERRILMLDLTLYEKELLAYRHSPAFEAEPGQKLWMKTLLNCLVSADVERGFWRFEALSPVEEARWDGTIGLAKGELILQKIARSDYGSELGRHQEVEYQEETLGPKPLEILKRVVDRLLGDPDSYSSTYAALMERKSTVQEDQVLQLYQRAYLNYHPKVSVQALRTHLMARYVTGTLVHNTEGFSPFPKVIQKVEKLIEKTEASQRTILVSLRCYYDRFCKENALKI